jgi:hypothetical protein
MLQADQFWQYAKEAIISASRAETENERRGLLDLAGTWTQAALIKRHAQADTAVAVFSCPRRAQTETKISKILRRY